MSKLKGRPNKIVQAEGYIETLKTSLDSLDYQSIQGAIDMLHSARIKGQQVFIMGNGGSASTATHMACDLAKNTQLNGWPLLKVQCLNDNMALFSAFANDEGYEKVFAMQLINHILPGDVVIAISTSGNSPNVLRAVAVAHEHGAQSVGLTGFTGGQLSNMVDLNVHVPSNIIEHIEDVHLMMGHLFTKALREMVADQQ